MLSQFRIGTRLGLSFATVLVLLVMIVFVATSRISTLNSTNERLVNQELADLAAASAINMEAGAAALKLLIILATSEREARIPVYKKMDQHNNNVDVLIDKLQSNQGVDQTKLEQLKNSQKKYRSSLQESVELLELDTESALEHFSDETSPALEKFLQLVDELVETKQNNLLIEQNAAIASSSKTLTLMVIMGVTALILGALLAWVVAHSITKPINNAVQIARRIANGELHSPPEYGGTDEAASLMHAFRDMCMGLQNLVSSIQGSSGGVDSSAQELTNSVNTVKQGSQDQSDAVSHIASLVNEFADEAAHAADATEGAKKQLDSARKLAQEGQALIHKATSEFIQISSTISGSAQAVETLSERAVSVRNLVTTVREIAEQTNLLALNAAIEAARAGESGRGFSVVADEVRGLANRTEQATSEINTVIDAIDSETKIAVDQITNGQRELEQGVSIIQEMVQPLEDLNSGAQASFAGLEQLEQTVNKQAAGSAGIQQDITNIDRLANHNLEATNEVCTIARSLTEISDDLRDQVMKFSIK
ncbi:methyl-accepting chemotaxis protein [Agarilytica rhodophyticola]|uniref:methyl-accepting chemotaxis protein n=1 Tax=Agarilytica rhodophyticola TaxID=1737490 RepID=UPI000B34571D|nr:methyl-accepting chemotaxis protein [Agarilytica rhodophyticola]